MNEADIKALLGPVLTPALIAILPPERREQGAKIGEMFTHHMPYNLDAWDGYPAARERVYQAFRAAGARPIVVSGDSHAFWANELYNAETGGKRVAVEFGATAISSPGPGESIAAIPLGEVFARHNREVRYNNQTAKGFVLLTLTHGDATAQLMAVSSVKERGFTTRPIATYRVAPGPDGGSGLKAV